MKIQLEKQIENSKNVAGLNAIIEHALKSKTVSEFNKAIQPDDRIQNADFFIYMVSSHVAIHEMFADEKQSERLLLITPN